MPTWQRLQDASLTDCQLDCIWRRIDHGADSRLNVLNPGKERTFAEEAMINGDVKTPAGNWVEKSVEAILLHVWVKNIPSEQNFAGLVEVLGF
jgi:hypothetical protein